MNQKDLFPKKIKSSHDHYTDARRKWLDGSVVVWFSCGVTSAVATKIILAEYPDATVNYCASTLSTEHPDNIRFLQDCERWFGKEINMMYSDKYKDIWDVFDKTGWLVGPGGARCTAELKKVVRKKAERAADQMQVFGFDAGESKRIERFREQNPEVYLLTPLADRGLTKQDCIAILEGSGIKRPAMYELGYKNNNCIGCVKGQSGYWNKIRVDFPDVFDRMAKQERKMNAAINKSYAGDGKRKRVFLDQLPPDAGRYSSEPEVQCGVLCSEVLEEIEDCEI